MKTRVQHLPADVHGLSAVARAGISAGANFEPVPVILRTEDISRPAEGAMAWKRCGARASPASSPASSQAC
jgi:hypothetical protein